MPDTVDPADPKPEEITLPRDVELCVRSLSPAAARERQEAVLETLDDLADRDVIEAVDVSVWGDRIHLGDGGSTAAAEGVHERVERLRSWAAAAGRRLDPVFERRTGHSSLAGGRYDVLVLPVMALVEYRDGAVSHVAPSSNGDDVVTVSERLARLSAAARARQVA